MNINGDAGASALSDSRAFKADPWNDGLGDSANRNAHIADGLYGAALVTAGIGLYLLLAAP